MKKAGKSGPNKAKRADGDDVRGKLREAGSADDAAKWSDPITPEEPEQGPGRDTPDPLPNGWIRRPVGWLAKRIAAMLVPGEKYTAMTVRGLLGAPSTRAAGRRVHVAMLLLKKRGVVRQQGFLDNGSDLAPQWMLTTAEPSATTSPPAAPRVTADDLYELARTLDNVRPEERAEADALRAEVLAMVDLGQEGTDPSALREYDAGKDHRPAKPWPVIARMGRGDTPERNVERMGASVRIFDVNDRDRLILRRPSVPPPPPEASAASAGGVQ